MAQGGTAAGDLIPQNAHIATDSSEGTSLRPPPGFPFPIFKLATTATNVQNPEQLDPQLRDLIASPSMLDAGMILCLRKV